MGWQAGRAMARRELTSQDKMRRMGITLLIVACLAGLALAGSQVRRIDPEGNEVAEGQDVEDVDITGDDDLIAQQPPGAADSDVPREAGGRADLPRPGRPGAPAAADRHRPGRHLPGRRAWWWTASSSPRRS